MKIGGLQPLTLSDYPGHLAAIVFTQGCNFRCPFCHNASLLALDRPGEMLTDTSDILDALQARRKLLDAVVISGGEPMLQPDLAECADRIRQKKLKVKLDTNGSHPTVLRALLSHRLLDYVAMDIKAPFRKYAKLAGVEVSTENIRQSIALLVESDIPCEFRTTFVPALLTQEDTEEIRSYLPDQARYTVQPFIAENALDESLRPATMDRAHCPDAPASIKPSNETCNLPHPIDLLSGE